MMEVGMCFGEDGRGGIEYETKRIVDVLMRKEENGGYTNRYPGYTFGPELLLSAIQNILCTNPNPTYFIVEVAFVWTALLAHTLMTPSIYNCMTT